MKDHFGSAEHLCRQIRELRSFEIQTRVPAAGRHIDAAMAAIEDQALANLRECRAEDVTNLRHIIFARSSRLIRALPLAQPSKELRLAYPNLVELCDWGSPDDVVELFRRGASVDRVLSILLAHRPGDRAWDRACMAATGAICDWNWFLAIDLSGTTDIARTAAFFRHLVELRRDEMVEELNLGSGAVPRRDCLTALILAGLQFRVGPGAPDNPFGDSWLPKLSAVCGSQHAMLEFQRIAGGLEGFLETRMDNREIPWLEGEA